MPHEPSIGDFALSAAPPVHLSVEDQVRFVEMLSNPPEPNEALRRAKSAHD